MSIQRISHEREEGSIVLTILVVIVSSALVVALVSLAQNSLRQSRRAGDSASALQVADAGISDAVAKATAFDAAFAVSPPVGPTGYTCTLTGSQKKCTGTVTVGSSQTAVEATRDPVATTPVWHVVSTAVDDASKQRRRIRADAVSTIGPAFALFVSSNLKLEAGTQVESYRNTIAPDTCTGKGFVGTNDALTMDLNTSGNSGNCRGTTWGYYIDGCVSYADVNPAEFLASSGCPPAPARKKATPAFVLENVYPLPGAPVAQPGPCTATNPLIGGQSYYWTSVELYDGCRIEPVAGNYKVKIVTPGDVNLGQGGGGGAIINDPTSNTPIVNSQCSSLAGNRKYCPRWAGNLEISVISKDPGTLVNIANNNVQFWGTINAPTAKLTACNGCPQSELWGSFIFAEADAPVQMTLRYDESLAGNNIGRYERRNWVQEAA